MDCLDSLAWRKKEKNTCIPPGFPQKQRKKKKEEDVLIVRGEKLICTNDEKRSTHTNVKS